MRVRCEECDGTLAETARLGSAEVSLRFRDVQLALDGSDVSEYDAGLAGPTVQARGCALKRRLDARCSSWSLLCDRHEGARRGVIAEVLSGGRYAARNVIMLSCVQSDAPRRAAALAMSFPP